MLSLHCSECSSVCLVGRPIIAPTFATFTGAFGIYNASQSTLDLPPRFRGRLVHHRRLARSGSARRTTQRRKPSVRAQCGDFAWKEYPCASNMQRSRRGHAVLERCAPRRRGPASSRPSQVLRARFSLVSRLLNSYTIVASATAPDSRSDEGAMLFHCDRGATTKTGPFRRNPKGRWGLRAISSSRFVGDERASASSSLLDLASQAPSAMV